MKRHTNMIRLFSTKTEKDIITNNITPEQRTEVMLFEARRTQTFDELIQDLSEENKRTLMIAPMTIGSDSEDIIHFVTTNNITMNDENIADVMQAFRFWFKVTAPDEYISPDFTPTMRSFVNGSMGE